MGKRIMGLLTQWWGGVRGKQGPSLSKADVGELRKQEILLGKRRERLSKRLEELVGEKHKVFETGAGAKEPEVREALAMRFELLTQEQSMTGHELNSVSREMLAVARVRMVRESKLGGGTGHAAGTLALSNADVARLSVAIGTSGQRQDERRMRLDAILEAGRDADELSRGELGKSGAEVLDAWGRMDQGLVEREAAYEQADTSVRRRLAGDRLAGATE